MTDKEKAKAYDEALSKCKAYIDDTEKRWSEEFSRATEEVFKEIFPELRESEDERVIKALEAFINRPEIAGKITFEARVEWLAWLEKQKEPHYTKRNALFDKCVENCGPKVMKEVSDKVDEMLGKEQKPAEIDVKALLTADRLASAEMTGRLKERSEILENPEKYGLCKPAEWSEKDDQLIGFIFDLLNSLVWRKEWAMDKKECLERLKSIRLQYHSHVTMTEAYKMGFEAGKASSWKPSEEQMSMLLAVINDPNNAGAESCQLALKSLYEQLKKLK